jgi:HindVP restriction endonuclease
MKIQKPGLFGLQHSNRDFTQADAWGKNQFNSSFPAALACFMHYKNIEPVYLVLDENLKLIHKKIGVEQLFGIYPTDKNLFFAFESDYTPYRHLVVGSLPRIDLVTQNAQNCLNGLEIKLTALPDSTTHHLNDDKFGSELVIRPDSIVYLALSIATLYRNNTNELLNKIGTTFDEIQNWSEGAEIMPFIPLMIKVIQGILIENTAKQTPLILQPIWKTIGKSPKLAENCLDIFVWSNFGFTRLFMDIATNELKTEHKITRQMRSVIWLFRMLYDFAKQGKINHSKILDELSYNTKNDKAFAVSGKVTQPLMASAELTTPRITKSDIKSIIVGGGHLLLSPERRFDAIVYNSPDLF